jgi:hypothetical protein
MIIPFRHYYRAPGTFSQITFAGRLDGGSGNQGQPTFPGFFDIYFDIYFG